MPKLDYGNMPIKKLILKLAIPSIITMIVASLNMVIDGVFMGNFIGSDALAAINLVMPVIMILFALVDMVASGAGVRVSVLLGKENHKKASETFSASVFMIFLLSITMTAFSMFFAKDIIFAVIEDKNLANLAYDYTKSFIPFFPLIAPFFAFDNFLWVCGKANKSMWINIWVSVFNILLNTYLIAYLGLEIFYAGLATAISMTIGSILSVAPFITNKLQLKFTKPAISFADMKMIIYNGSSEFFENISGSFMIALSNGIMLSVAGANGVAAMSVIYYIEMLLMPVLGGVIGAIQPILSYNYGAKNHERIREIFRVTCIISVIISIIAVLIMILFPQYLVSIFSNDNDIEMREIAITGLLLYAPSYLFTWFNIIVGTFLTSFEKAKESVLLMSLESVIFPIFFFIILSSTIGINGMFLAQSVSAFFTFGVSVFMWNRVKSNVLKIK